LADYVEVDDVRLCPVTDEAKAGANPADTTTPWVFNAAFRNLRSNERVDFIGSYAINGYIYHATAFSPNNPGGSAYVSGRRNGGPTYPDSWFTTLESVPFPSLTPNFTDSYWVDTWPTPADIEPTDLTTWAHSSMYMDRVAMTRHGQGVNSGFMDGHAELVTVPTLWDLHWFRNWEEAKKSGRRPGGRGGRRHP